MSKERLNCIKGSREKNLHCTCNLLFKILELIAKEFYYCKLDLLVALFEIY